MKPDPASMLALATSLAWPRVPAFAGAPATAGAVRAPPVKTCATRFPWPRPASTRPRSPTCTRARSRPHLRGAADLRLPGAAGMRIKPQTAVAMPEVSAATSAASSSASSPASTSPTTRPSRGQPRELVAADYVYSIKRHYDPRWKSPTSSCSRTRRCWACPSCASRPGRQEPFDYDTEVEGLRALDRYTFEVRAGPSPPRFPTTSPTASTGAVAREVSRPTRTRSMEHPVGTGPFRLAQWKRSSRIVLERNPGFRDALRRGPAGRRPRRRVRHRGAGWRAGACR
jgi:hypothetical protein